MRRVAVVGSGISGLSVAHGLASHAQVTLFEADAYFGGHAHTVDMTLDGVSHGVDTGFLVLNDRTYPKLLRLFSELGVETAPSEMSFSVQVPGVAGVAGVGKAGIEWSGNNLNTVFAQRSNLLRPGFWRMLRDIARFNRETTALAVKGEEAALDQTTGAFLTLHGFSVEFRDWYFLPMIGCFWSASVDQILHFPVATLIRFCHNHGLIQTTDRPQWRTVRGGSRTYVDKMVSGVADARLNAPVRRVQRVSGGALVSTDNATEYFDEVVMACHTDQSLALLDSPSPMETAVLGAIRYQNNRAVLHTDDSLLPKRRLAWAAWNYERAAHDARERSAVCLHYLLNRLQPLPFTRPVILSLNPITEPHAGSVHGEFEYAHPMFDAAAIAAQTHVAMLQGVRHTWFCGAWTRYGFHEDGLMSGLAVRDALRQRLAISPVATPAEFV